MVTVLDPQASVDERERFLAGANAMLVLGARADILTVYEVSAEDACFVSELWTIGTCADLPTLRLGLERKLDVVQRICDALAAVHAAGVVHGCLCPGNVLLDDDLQPVLSEVGVVDVSKKLDALDDPQGYAAFASPEARQGEALSWASDVYSVGRFLQFVLLGETVEHETLAIPRLERLAKSAPAGLVRIVRKCTAAHVTHRYLTIEDLRADLLRYGRHAEVGMGHADVVEENPTGLMASRSPPSQRRRAAPRGTGAKRSGAVWWAALAIASAGAAAGAYVLLGG